MFRIVGKMRTDEIKLVNAPSGEEAEQFYRRNDVPPVEDERLHVVRIFRLNNAVNIKFGQIAGFDYFTHVQQ
jgi:hypothetical protein